MLGGAVGALSSEDPLKGALSGSVAGALSEILGEMITQNPDEYLRDAMLDDSNPDALENFLSNYNRYVGITTDIAQALTAGIAVALNLDITTANNVANNAVKNNYASLCAAAALAADIAVTQLMRHIGMTLGAVAIATLIEEAKDGPLATLTENQWKTLIALCKAQGHTMDAAPDLDNRDEGFAAHEGQAQTLATPLPENLPTLEGFGTYDGIDTSILFKELQRIYILYEKAHPQGGIPYVGRASGWGDIDNPADIKKIVEKRDRNHHMNAQEFLPAQQKLPSLNPDAIRGMEQIKIDEGGGAQSQGGTSSNKINSICDKNPKKEQYMDAAKNEFGEQ